LKKATSGVLSLLGDDGYPYGVPMSYVAEGTKLYFHSAVEGEKIDAIKNNPKASFAIILQDEVFKERFTTRYISLILFGKTRFVLDENEKRWILALFAEKYGIDDRKAAEEEVEKSLDHVAIISFSIENKSGKKSKYLLDVQ
jgi:nitroimidazol reductase NimA-like FMN-containing flavoprotein (pyridoxamine 5'-phosphate oxidase superfamily)